MRGALAGFVFAGNLLALTACTHDSGTSGSSSSTSSSGSASSAPPSSSSSVASSATPASASSSGPQANLAALTELGFYTSVSGDVQYLPYVAYGSGATQRPLPTADFPALKTLSGGDNLILFGPLPSSLGAPTVFRYERDGGSYTFVSGNTLDDMFATIPQGTRLGQPVSNLVRRAGVAAGTYFIHEFVGANGDKYAGFGLAP